MIAIITTKELECQHPKDEMEYQAKEEDTNVPESLTCGMCGKDLDLEILEPDWDAIVKEDNLDYEENNE
tara:strand:+ start:193 stop:399 length:207 start_codon:yes stop_codon:yes gene_type:complete